MKRLKGSYLKDKRLDEWFKELSKSDFQDLKTDYVTRYNAVEDFLITEVHSLVSVGAALKDGIFLNDHGPEHVKTVIQHASDLMSTKDCNITVYESYLLLTAIQLHDIGNILGRVKHEDRLPELNGRLDALLGGDTPEKRLLFNIAQAHGGTHIGDKDTISHIVEDPVLSQPVHARFLAAVLRFADELADDSRRTSAYAMEINAIKDVSLIYHKYSSALQSVTIDKNNEVRLVFVLNHSDAEASYGVNGHSRRLIDEILSRTLKMHRERIYCMKFLRPQIAIDSVTVKISVFKSNRATYPLLSVGYSLTDRGYPDVHDSAIYAICPELREWYNGKKLDGSSLLEAISARIEGDQL